MHKSIIGFVGLGAGILGFAVGIFAYVRVQVLQSYPFYEGVFGDRSFFLGLTYTGALEVSSAVAALGVFLWTYSCAPGEKGARLRKALGETSLVFGVIVAGVVYVETRLLWGEVLPGVHVWPGLSGGGGYPWGTERVAYNTCFIPSAVRGDCEFLNYNELLLIGLVCAVAGFMLWYGNPQEPSVRQEKEGPSAYFVPFGTLLSGVNIGVPIVMRNPDSWNTPNSLITRFEGVP